MRPVLVRPAGAADHVWVAEVMRTRPIALNYLPEARVDERGCLIGELDDCRVGLLTYRVAADGVQVASVDSLVQGIGAGTALMCAVRGLARSLGVRRLWLGIANGDIHALWYYQRLGLRLTRVHHDAIEARGAPWCSPDNGIRARDVFILEAEP